MVKNTKKTCEALMTRSLVGSDPAIIAPFLMCLFARLDSVNIQWAIMRGWEGLPYFTRHDVDFLVARCDLRRVIEIARDVAQEVGWVQYGSFKFSNLRSRWFLLVGKEEVSYLQLDFFTEASLRGVPFLDSRRWLQQRKMNEAGIWHMDIGYAACCTLLKELIANGKLDGELRHLQIRQAIKDDREHYELALSESLGDAALVDQIVTYSEDENWEGLAKLSQMIRRFVMRFRFRNMLGQLEYLFDVVRLQCFPHLRLFIAFVGPDGCGKTTMAHALMDRFPNRPFSKFYYIHMNFGFFPRLREIKRGMLACIGKKVTFAADPEPGAKHIGMQSPHAKWRSMIYVFYYGLNMALGRLKFLFWRSFSGMIIADRYYYDYYYMRGHLHCPKWFLNCVGAFVPKPDLVFVLERAAEEIYAQKPELAIDEIQRQQGAIRSCMGGKRFARFIDASGGVELTVAKVSREIESWLIEQGRNLR